MIVETQTPTGWEQRQPKLGETYRKVYPTGHIATMVYQGGAVSQPELTPVVFTEVTGASTTNSNFTKITAKEGSTLTIQGTLAIPDRAFITPIEKENIATSEITTLYVETRVVDGRFSVELTLPVGKYRITQELMNAELPQAAFSLDTVEIYITI
ncbi:hypothetical protein [Vibrio vulnificus]|uniref:hypothetical protein n=1 Tax=Vibrio vulnificus TaxID=672 RepID=UPI0019D4BA27|nr:hypothetical protein [Vibrio vulnificus]MBN8093897.1 hypothetical protein [Vibrio vulnificus]HDY7894718.1 hypothetical protein [Vibrio vulnificus]